MPKKGAEIVDLNATLLHQTDGAWLVKTEKGQGWVPKVVGEWEASNGNPMRGVITLPTSWAEDKKLV